MRDIEQTHLPICTGLDPLKACASSKHWLLACSMRTVRFLFLLILLVVSHGGLPGAIPHLEAAHAHEMASASHAHDDRTLDVVEVEPKPDAYASDDLVTHGASHSHGSIALPDDAEVLANSFLSRVLLRPGEAAPLISDPPSPLTQPPSA